MMRLLILYVSFGLLMHACSGDAQKSKIWMPGDSDQKAIQTALIQAKPGDTLFFGEGIFNFYSGLSLEGIEGITLKGKGMDKTIFSFKGQTEGAEGLTVKANRFTIEDMAIEDTKGDAIKVMDSENVTFRRLRVEWTGGPDSTNGSYGIYPVSCKNVLMEECVARGASDAGIYVGQSENAVIRRNIAEFNVAGIEVENTIHADVYENIAINNTAGILVFDLPDLPKKNGKYVRIFNNQIRDNNLPNFSPMGISVSMLPAGTGTILMACQYVEVFGNQIHNHQSIGTAIVNLNMMKRKTEDSLFNIYPSSIFIHDNVYSAGTQIPDTSREFGVMLFSLFKGNTPLIVTDGFPNPALVVNGEVPPEHRICIRNNGEVSFFNLAMQSTDITAYDCGHEPLAPVNIPGLQP